MKRDSVSKNLVFQFFYQVVMLVLPLIISPYLTRTLGSSGLGAYTYSYTIAYYFILFANLGISRHGQRTVAEKIAKKEDYQKAFWSILYLHFLVSAVVAAIYFIFVFIFCKDNKALFLVEGIFVCSAIFDITWFFYGIEKFKSVVIKNTIIKIIEFALIFLFVKSQADLIIYAIIVSSGIFLGQLVLLPGALKICKPVFVKKEEIISNIKPMFVFFISVLAVSLYTVFDKVLIGLMVDKSNVAFYEYSNKIISIPLTFITIIGTVLFPKACQLASQNDTAGQKKYINASLLLTSFIGMGTMFGLFSISKEFSIIYFGEGFSECGMIMICMSGLPYIIGVGEIIRSQFMIPYHMDFHFNFCIVANAILNIVLSIALIPVLGVYGAVVGTCAAELFGCSYQLFICRKYLKLKDIFAKLFPFVFIGFFMFGFINILSSFLNEGIVGLIVKVLSGAFVFCAASFLYIYLFEKDVWHMFLDKFKRHKTKN